MSALDHIEHDASPDAGLTESSSILLCGFAVSQSQQLYNILHEAYPLVQIGIIDSLDAFTRAYNPQSIICVVFSDACTHQDLTVARRLAPFALKVMMVPEDMQPETIESFFRSGLDNYFTFQSANLLVARLEGYTTQHAQRVAAAGLTTGNLLPPGHADQLTDNALEYSEAHLMALIESFDHAIVLFDHQLSVLTYNTRAARHFAKAFGPIPMWGFNLLQVELPDMIRPLVEYLLPHFRHCLNGIRYRELLPAHLFTDNRRFEFYFNPVWLNHRIIGVSAIMHDVTEEVWAIERLRASEAELQAIFQSTNDAIFLLGPNRELLRFNGEFARQYTRDFGQAPKVGKTYRELFAPFLPQSLYRLSETYQDQAYMGLTVSYEWSSVGSEPEHFEESLYPILEADGNVKAMVYTRRNITERRRNEEYTLRRQRELMDALVEGQDQERRRIAAELHDGVGQIIHAMSLNLHALDLQLQKSQIQRPEVLGVIRTQMEETIDEIRSISHNLMPRVLQDFGLEHALRQMCDRLQHNRNKQGNPTPDIRLEVLSMPQGMMKSAQASLYRIVQEIVHNAIKHASAQKVVIQINERDGYLVLMIEDDGVGFDTRKMQHSRGIGLGNIEARVKLMGGSQNIESSPDNGTTFVIEIPESRILLTWPKVKGHEIT